VKRAVTILDAAGDTNLFATWFRKRHSWQAWFAFLAALFALPMNDTELKVFRDCTNREAPPTLAAREAWLVCGRRAGKSFILALVAVFLACFHSYRQYLQPGERGTIVVIAADRRQARTIFRYVRGLLKNVPMLRHMIERETAEAFDLTNSVTIEIQTASFRSTRGYTLIAALLDELAFWRSDDSANPDKEILAALRPAMATIPNAMLLCASSPYARRGVLWDAYRKHYGKDGSILVWKAPTRIMNPSVPQAVIDEAIEKDPAEARAEYLAEFRSDVETFISREVVDAATVQGRSLLPRIESAAHVAFVDPSGGSSDSMTLGIAHMEGERAVLDCVIERRPPFSPDDVTKEFADTIRAYGIASVTGDRYGGMWPRERFAQHGIDYQTAPHTKSDIYLTLLPLLNSGRIELLDNPRLATQLCSLERRTARGGRDNVDHPPSAHDDLVNAAAGALVAASQREAQSIVFNSPILCFKDGSSSMPHLDQPQKSSTQLWYEWANGGGQFWGPV
jgi:hypothetical protein